MVVAGMLRKHFSRCEPGGCAHPMAVANSSKIVKLSMGVVETCTPDNKMPARNGAANVEFRRVMASDTDEDPAEWPCQRESWFCMSVCISRDKARTISATFLLSLPNLAMLSCTQASASS